MEGLLHVHAAGLDKFGKNVPLGPDDGLIIPLHAAGDHQIPAGLHGAGLHHAAHGDVADADHRHGERLAAEHAPVEEAVTERHPQFIQIGRRGQPPFSHAFDRLCT